MKLIKSIPPTEIEELHITYPKISYSAEIRNGIITSLETTDTALIKYIKTKGLKLGTTK